MAGKVTEYEDYKLAVESAEAKFAALGEARMQVAGVWQEYVGVLGHKNLARLLTGSMSADKILDRANERLQLAGE